MQPGDIIADKFRVERVLGQGGMGIVVVATHLKLDQTVALKFLHENIAWDAGVIERLMREARASAKLKSEHACRVMDVGQLPTGTPYIVMELLEGQDLSAVIRKAPLSPAVAADYVLQACVAIAEAHAAGIIHRDLKPSNLFVSERLDGSPLIKVLDFGIAKAQAKAEIELTRTSAVMGSPGYMSPEQLRSAKDVDVRTDIWSLGVIMYEAVSGRLPFLAETITELAVKVSMDPYEPLDTDPAYFAVVARCLEKPVDRRYSSVAELARDLSKVAGSRGTTSAAMIARLSGQRASVPAPSESSPVMSGIAATLPATASDTPLVVESSAPARRDKTPLLPQSTTLSSAATVREPEKASSKKGYVAGGIGLVAIGGIVTGVVVTRGPDETRMPAPGSGTAVAVERPKPKLTRVRVRIAEPVLDPSKVTLALGEGGTSILPTATKRAIDLSTRVAIAVQGTERFLNKVMHGEISTALDRLGKSNAGPESQANVFALGKQATSLQVGPLAALSGKALGPIEKYRDAIVFAPEVGLPEVIGELEKAPFDGRTFAVVISSPTMFAEATTTALKQRLRKARIELHYITIEGDDEPSDSARALAGKNAQTIKKPKDLAGAIATIATRIAGETELSFDVPEDAWRASKDARIEVNGHARRIETGQNQIILE